jgi:hypothetical protein
MLTLVLFASALSLATTQTPLTSQDPPDRGATVLVAARPRIMEARDDSPVPTRHVCRFERATGSSMQTRVCRDVPLYNYQSPEAREFMQRFQRIRLPDEGVLATPPGPGG